MKRYLSFLFFIVPLFSIAQWNVNTAVNTPVCVQPYDQQDVRIVSDEKGGAILVWQDFRGDASQNVSDIYVQRLNAAGYPLWALNGIGVCTLPSDQFAPFLKEDGNGGAVIIWTDSRTDNGDIYAQRVDSTGAVLWGANGVPVVAKTKLQQNGKLISDGAGGAIVVWQDDTASASNIFAQRISGNGATLWTAGGVAICAAANAQSNPRIETDGSGGAIIVWQDKRNGADYDIYAQRVNASGAVQWQANGIFVNSVVGTESNPRLEPDGSGGAIVAWQDKRSGVSYDIYAQRINASGNRLWSVNGIPVCTAAGSQSAIDMTSESISGAIIVWKDERNGNLDVYAQMIGLNGAAGWTANGIAVAGGSYSQLNPNIVSDGSGGAIITWQDSSMGSWDAYSAKVMFTGSVQWKVPVGNAANHQFSPKNVADGTGGSIYAWPDWRPGSHSDIYAQRILSNGITAGIGEYRSDFVGTEVYPNPFREVAAIYSEGKSLNIFNALGEEVFPVISKHSGLFKIERGTLPAGMYFFRAGDEMGNYRTGNFIIRD